MSNYEIPDVPDWMSGPIESPASEVDDGVPVVADDDAENLRTLIIRLREPYDENDKPRNGFSTDMMIAADRLEALTARYRTPRSLRLFPIPTHRMTIRDMMWPDESYKGLDAGVRFAVRVLHAAGFETCQSCQGGKGHAYDRPTVEMVSTGDDSEGFGALAALQAYGLPVADIAILWPVLNGLPYERLWRITFSKTMEDRANDKPIFIYGYRAE